MTVDTEDNQVMDMSEYRTVAPETDEYMEAQNHQPAKTRLSKRRKALPKDGWRLTPTAVKILIAAVAVVVILFAFIWEAVYDGGQGYGAEPRSDRRRQEDAGNFPPRARSEIQDSLSNMDWVVPAFLPINEYSRPGTLIGKVNAIVIHYIGNPDTTAWQNRNYFANLEITEETYASSNFIIGLDGEIMQCVPVDEVAYASNNRNEDTISIELCHPDETGQFTEETYASAVRLTAWLCEQYGLTSADIIRHFDVTGKICPKYFVENEDAWEAFKADVMQAVAKK